MRIARSLLLVLLLCLGSVSFMTLLDFHHSSLASCDPPPEPPKKPPKK